MDQEVVNIADAKKRFSWLVGQVAHGKKKVLITKRGKPMARLVPVIDRDAHLADAKGWLEDDDPFFDLMTGIIQARDAHQPRVFRHE